MDETSCPVCWEEFSDLIGKTYILEYLPCHHHICQACYNSMHTCHICPLCRGTMISLVSILIYLSNIVSSFNFFVLQHVKVLENGKWRYINRDVYGRTSQQRWRHFTNPRSFFRQVFDFIRFFLCCGFLCPQYFDLNNVEEGYPLLGNSEN